MIVFVLLAAIFIGISSFFATQLIKRRKVLIWWDYFFPYTGTIAWFLLTIFNVGKTASLSNFVIENFWITMISIIVPWIVFAVSFIPKVTASIFPRILTYLPMTFSIIIRLTIDTLPE